MQIMRCNAVRMPEDVNVILFLATLEGKEGNYNEAFALARHALTLGSMMNTALATFARIALCAGQPLHALMAFQLLQVSPRGEELQSTIWPAGMPPHESVTRPQESFYDADIAEALLLTKQRLDGATFLHKNPSDDDLCGLLGVIVCEVPYHATCIHSALLY
jgi:hypothetical protein